MNPIALEKSNATYPFEDLSEYIWSIVPDELIVFDVETTGLDARSDRVLEIGAVHYKKSEYKSTGEVVTFQCFVKQKKTIPLESIKINSITAEMVKDGDDEFTALERFFDFVGNRQICAYNASFDVKFMNAMARRSRYASHPILIEKDVIDIYKYVRDNLDIKPNYKLTTVAKNLGVKVDNSHRAVADSVTALAVYINAIQRIGATEKIFRSRQQERNAELLERSRRENTNIEHTSHRFTPLEGERSSDLSFDLSTKTKGRKLDVSTANNSKIEARHPKKEKFHWSLIIILIVFVGVLYNYLPLLFKSSILGDGAYP